MLKDHMTEGRGQSRDNSFEEKLPECPFYRRFIKYAVICEGPEENLTSQVNFQTTAQRKDYLDRFCYCMNFDKCVIAKALYAKYE